MVKGSCKTNLDEYKREIWPVNFIEIPRLGDYVRSEAGRELKVVRITHFNCKFTDMPFISIELHNE